LKCDLDQVLHGDSSINGSNNGSLKILPRFALTGWFSAPLITLISAPHLPINNASFFSYFLASFLCILRNCFFPSLYFSSSKIICCFNYERLSPYWIDICISIIEWFFKPLLVYFWPILQCSSSSVFIRKRLFYPGDFAVDILQCTLSSSSAKRLKESDLVRDSASNLFRCQFLKNRFLFFYKVSKPFYNSNTPTRHSPQKKTHKRKGWRIRK
jgi:hypothetical protein